LNLKENEKEFIWVAGGGGETCRIGGETISGMVTEANGNTVAGATVTVYRVAPGEAVTVAETDSTGRYTMQTAPGLYLVRVKHPVSYPVDAALARLSRPDLVRPEILGLGALKGSAAAQIGLGVVKSGRSTGVTRGKIIMVGATVKVGFGSGRIVQLTGQIISSKMAEPGDSGSLLLDGGNKAIGLLFAGSASVTLYNPIDQVLQALNVTLTGEDSRERHAQPVYPDLEALCRKRSESLLSLPNVVGVAVGHKQKNGVQTRKLCIVVLVEEKKKRQDLPEDSLIPEEIDGMQTDVVQSGKLETGTTGPWYGKRLDRRARMRPARPGLSIGHYRVSAGTFGAVVYDRENGEPFILSNNHVLANATDGRDGLSLPGDLILQPGSRDGGNNPADAIGTLHRYVPLRFL
jgi:hypothetical protein